jgi:hypothetical protein
VKAREYGSIEQFLIMPGEKPDQDKILSVKQIEVDYLPAAVYPLLVFGVLLIIFLHPLCSLLFLIPAGWLTVCHRRKARRAQVTVYTASGTYVVNLSECKELEAAINKDKSSGKP